MASGTDWDLWDVWGTSASDVYAVGVWGTILHYDGTAWNDVGDPNMSLLYGVWGTSSGDVHAVGLYGTMLRGER